MNYFPMFTDIKNRDILICGGGKHAQEKVERLMPFKPKIRIISENLSEELLSRADIFSEKRRVTREDLLSYPVFVVAAESKEENERIAAMCRDLHIPVNAVDQPKDCDFIFPSMIVSENLCVGVSTGGVSPTGAICLKNRFSETIPDEIDDILLWVKGFKEKLKRENIERTALNKTLRLVMDEALTRQRILTDDEVKALLIKNNL